MHCRLSMSCYIAAAPHRLDFRLASLLPVLSACLRCCGVNSTLHCRLAAGPLCAECHPALPLRFLPRPGLDAQHARVALCAQQLVSWAGGRRAIVLCSCPVGMRDMCGWHAVVTAGGVAIIACVPMLHHTPARHVQQRNERQGFHHCNPESSTKCSTTALLAAGPKATGMTTCGSAPRAVAGSASGKPRADCTPS